MQKTLSHKVEDFNTFFKNVVSISITLLFLNFSHMSYQGVAAVSQTPTFKIVVTFEMSEENLSVFSAVSQMETLCPKLSIKSSQTRLLLF